MEWLTSIPSPFISALFLTSIDMEAYIVEWLNLLGRWVHLVTGIAWIGASFYFIWLDNHLQPTQPSSDTARGVSGELWSIHGGGFYHAQKYKVSPPSLPARLHWFKWEAYTTFLSGFFLLGLIYWYQADIYLIDPATLALSQPVAIGLSILTVVGGWLVYDVLCRSPLGQHDSAMAVVLLLFLTGVAWGLCQVFSGRGAYIHFGAMLGTIMVGNVFFVIMPGQRDLVAAKNDGRPPNPIHGIRAKQRSVHNTYFTLPVLFVMISNHYAMTYSHAFNWVILVAISLMGALVRVHFVKAHFGKPSPIPLTAALLLLAGIFIALMPENLRSGSETHSGAANQIVAERASSVSDTSVFAIIEQRCASCHHAQPSHPGFTSAPAGVEFNTIENMLTHAAAIYQQSVVTRAMPIGNLTGMTDGEREQIEQWYVTQ